MPLLIYTGALGPATINFGSAGEFVKDVPKLVEEPLAAALIAKGHCILAAEPTVTKKSKGE